MRVRIAPRFSLLALLTAVAVGGCGQVASAPQAHDPANHATYQVQQDEGPTGRVICNRRYRNCLRTLVPDLGDSAIQTCQQRRDTCLDALGEGYFIRR